MKEANYESSRDKGERKLAGHVVGATGKGSEAGAGEQVGEGGR